ncbi:MAG: YceI family protein [Candidatus Dormibacteraeota bacterium]|nr:YceI family protein [Candidatus Dormibacteraeota bacterium]
MTATTLVRQQAGVWDVDTAHSGVEFVARYLMATKVRGHFDTWSATLTTGETSEAAVEATIQAASINTGNEGRDAHLKGADFFDVEKYPTLDFKSTAVSELRGNEFTVTGDLSMHGVIKPVTLNVEFAGTMKDLYGNTRTTFSATTEIDREQWGLNWNAALETGGVLVSKKIKLEFEVQFIQRKDA